MTWTVLLFVFAANGSVTEFHKVIQAGSKQECLQVAGDDAKRILSDRPDLMIGIGCKPGDVTAPTLPGVNT